MAGALSGAPELLSWNQIGISLASPITVRGVLALGPVLVFLLQLWEGRLLSSPYSLTSIVLYSTFALSAAFVRQRATWSAASAGRAERARIRGCGRRHRPLNITRLVINLALR